MPSQRLAALLIFPCLWIAGGLVICITGPMALWAYLSVFALGLVCLGLALIASRSACSHCGTNVRGFFLPRSSVVCRSCKSPQPRSINTALAVAKGIGAVVFIASCSVVFPDIYANATWDPIGNATDYGWGSEPCVIRNSVGPGNGRGYFAYLRSADCPMAMLSTFTYFVFVHKSNEPSTSGNLVYRYDPASNGSRQSPPPRIAWRNAGTITIETLGKSLYVSRRVAALNGISIVYSIVPNE
jgi:hypothetical protein